MINTLKHLMMPHQSNNHRARLLHPAGLAILVAISIFLNTWGMSVSVFLLAPKGMVLGFASSIDANTIIAMTNERRAEFGLSALTQNGQLAEAARQKAVHMFEKDYWSHIAPDGTTPWQFIRSAGYNYSVAGENLARDFADNGGVVSAWMSSPTHKENIVHEKYTEIGVAVVNGHLEGMETTLVVQMFGTRSIVASGVVPQDSTPIQTESVQTATAEVIEQAEVVLDDLAVTVVDSELVVPEVQIALENELQPVLAEQSSLPISLTSVPISLRMSPLFVTKVFVTSLVLLLFTVLLSDLWAVKKHFTPRLVGRTWAHLGMLSIVVFMVLVSGQGVIR